MPKNNDTSDDGSDNECREERAGLFAEPTALPIGADADCHQRGQRQHRQHERRVEVRSTYGQGTESEGVGDQGRHGPGEHGRRGDDQQNVIEEQK